MNYELGSICNCIGVACGEVVQVSYGREEGVRSFQADIALWNERRRQY